MKKIYKYNLETVDKQSFMIPKGSQVLTVQIQNGEPKLWILVDPKETTRRLKTFYVRGTGNPIDGEIGTYIGTYQLRDGALVFHVFEE